MLLDELDDNAISDLVHQAMRYIHVYRGQREDAYQFGYMIGLQLRHRLRMTSPGNRMLHRRNLALAIFKRMSVFVRYRGSDCEYTDSLAPEPRELDFTEKELLAERMARLSPRELRLINRYWFDGLNILEIATELGVSKQRVSRLMIRAMQKMRGESPKIATSNN